MSNFNRIAPAIVVQRDRRQSALYRIIKAEHPCVLLQEDNPDKLLPIDAQSIFLPLTGDSYAEYLTFLQPQGFVFTGLAHGSLLKAAQQKRLYVVQLLLCEEFVAANAAITAECAVGLCIADTAHCLADLNIAVFGGGRIAMQLVQRLVALGAKNVYLFARNSQQRQMAQLLGARAYPLPAQSRLALCDVVFNTAPAMVLTNDELAFLPRHAVLYELASAPGFSAPEAQRLGLKTVSAVGLPGKYAPESAAQLIWTHALRRIEEILG